MDVATLQERYDSINAEADLLAGGLYDIPRRVVLFRHLYCDSGGNHPFALIAAHGALWGLGYFESGGSLGRFIARRYYFNADERAYRLGILQDFAEGFRRVNRQVCVDTYSNYHFVQRYGREVGAEEIVPATLLDALNRIHASRESDKPLSDAERRLVFEQSFCFEQEVTVAPGVKAAIDGFQCRIMRSLCMHPLVRFAYFPHMKYFFFRNFGDQAERIERGFQAFDLAARAGWEKVDRSLREYGVMPLRHLEDPHHALSEIRAQLARHSKIAQAIL
jgi:hypothetical protein